MSLKKKGLGRGLDAILAGGRNEELLTPEEGEKRPAGIAAIPVSQIETNPFQPRSEFDQDALEELATSIRELGIIQPITVRKTGAHSYQLISGERRFRASVLAGLKEIPAYLRTANDQEMLEMALIENIQRENLNAIEVALSYQRLMEDCKLTQEKLSERVAKKRSTITNYLRLLRLPNEIQAALRTEQISMGHARALVNVEDAKTQIRLLEKTLKNDLSVRAVEELVRNLAKPAAPAGSDSDENYEYAELTEKLVDFFHSNIEIRKSGRGGKIIISFRSDDDLRRISELLK